MMAAYKVPNGTFFAQFPFVTSPVAREEEQKSEAQNAEILAYNIHVVQLCRLNVRLRDAQSTIR